MCVCECVLPNVCLETALGLRDGTVLLLPL